MKNIIIAYIFLIIAVIILFVFKSGNNNFNLFGKKTSASAIIDGKKFDLILAKTEKEQIDGLSKRSGLDKNSGMLFVFKNKDYYPFWMKNVKFAIDIIFIEDNKIVDIFENLQPINNQEKNLNIYRPKQKANYTLEINGGLSSSYNFKIGDKVEFSGL